MKYRALLVKHLNGNDFNEHGCAVRGDEPINELERMHASLIHKKLEHFPRLYFILRGDDNGKD